MIGDLIIASLSHCLLIGGSTQPFKLTGQRLEELVLKSKCTKLQCVASNWEQAQCAALRAAHLVCSSLGCCMPGKHILDKCAAIVMAVLN